MPVVRDRSDVENALNEPELLPYASPDAAGGATIALRDRMARFSPPELHAKRRRAVEAAIASVDPEQLAVSAQRITGDVLDAAAGRCVDVLAELAYAVPTRALAELLGVTLEVADLAAVVGVIGRGAPADGGTDAATERILEACRPHHSGAVAVASVLYQNFDATAALIATRLVAFATGRVPVPAVPRTRRIARTPVALGQLTVDRDEVVQVEIGAAGFPFGAGPHACPGRELSERLADAVVDAIGASGRVVDVDALASDADGRPTCLLLRA